MKKTIELIKGVMDLFKCISISGTASFMIILISLYVISKIGMIGVVISLIFFVFFIIAGVGYLSRI